MKTSLRPRLDRLRLPTATFRAWPAGAAPCAAAGRPAPYSPWFLAAVILGLGLALLPLTGCNMFAAFQYIIQGEPTKDPEFTKLKDKKVAVVCYAPARVRYNADDVDTEVAKGVSALLKRNGKAIDVVDPDQVADWLDQHANWSDVTEVGKEFSADYVVFVDIQEFSVYEENSPNMLRGRSYVDIRVYDVVNEGAVVYSTDLESIYPLGRPIPAGEKRETSFRREYLARLSDEIGRHFYPYVPGEDVKLY